MKLNQKAIAPRTALYVGKRLSIRVKELDRSHYNPIAIKVMMQSEINIPVSNKQPKNHSIQLVGRNTWEVSFRPCY